MMQDTMELGVPRRLIPFIRDVNMNGNTDEKAALLLVEGLFLSGSVTLEKAAELAGQSVLDFIDTLQKQGIPWGSYDDDEYSADLATLNEMKEA